MLKGWKKRFNLLLVFISWQCMALPDIPSFMDCEDIVFNAGFQDDSQASNGSSGLSGNHTRTIFSNGQNRNYYIYAPSTYTSFDALPLMILWHGAGGAGTAPTQAQNMRSFWQSTAEINNIIILAQEATGASGGWVPGTDFLILSDILDDLYMDYNIEKTRIYGHGFSAGGHVMHTLMLFNSLEFAAYTVSAGVLEAHAGLSAPANADRIIPVFVSIGLSDSGLIGFVQSNHTVFNNAGWIDNNTYWLDEFNGGHQIDSQLPEKSWDKLCTFSTLQ